MTEKQKKLIEILRQMFQLDHSDLDFGIYRIMNAKAGEIKDFLENDLITSIKDAFASSANEALKRELAEAEAAARELGIAPETSPKVQELRSRLASTADSSELENEVYSHLTTFFSRYYKDGDFISLRRYKKDTYAIPYEGEEVKLYWANFDQYYIKTSEYFRDYTFKVSTGSGLIEGEEKKVHFKLVEADTETNNNKATTGKERRFVLHEENPAEVKDGELYLYFEYKVVNKGSQKDLNKKAIETIFGLEGLDDWLPLLKTPAPTEKNKDRTLLEKHLDSYTARNTFDYFIHKDLGGFLNRELDFYIKNEMLYLDDIEGAETARIEASLKKIKTFKTIAKKIIAFLTQLEEFQKRLWLKKKFVIETDYCITLDKIDEKYYEEILANEAQLAEWKKLFDVTVETVEDLKNEPFLVLDTKFFDNDFKNRLLGEFDDLDEEIDGVLINSENFGALNLLQKKYREQIKTVYIDPPYNTDSAPILYKNNYKHSSWIALINDRINLSKKLLCDVGVKIIAIDDTEIINLSKVLEDSLANYRQTRVTIIHNPKGSITKDFNRVHEYAVFLTPEDKKDIIARTLEENEVPRKLRRWGENSKRSERPLSFYPIYVKNNKIVRIGNVPPDNFHPSSKNILMKNGGVEIWPIDQHGIERRWNFGLDSIGENLSRIIVKKVNNELDLFLTHELTVPKTVWTGGQYDAGKYGNNLLINIFGDKKFDFPKSINLVKQCIHITRGRDISAIILDYFAGSGTTGHATIKLNREDNGKRKYILVEMGQYFDTVTKLPPFVKTTFSFLIFQPSYAALA